MKKFTFFAAAVIAVTVSSCTKETTVAPTKVKTDVATAISRDTISNEAQVNSMIAPSDTISNISPLLKGKKK
jgi:hypothetical protein